MADAADATTVDAFLGGRLSIRQMARGYRAGLDAVLLAAYAPVRPGCRERVLDLGAGVGVVGLAIAARVGDANVVLAEREPSAAVLARENIATNGLEGRVEVVEIDVLAGARALHDSPLDAPLRPAAFAHVVSNPPFTTAGEGTPSPSVSKCAAHQMPADALDRWVAFAATATAAGGTATLIHRADALHRLLDAMGRRFGALTIKAVHSRADAPAMRVLVRGVKGSRAPLSVLPGLVLMDREGRYLPPLEDVLRHGAALDG